MPTAYTLPQRLAAEALGTALLLAAIVGSGIMGDTLAGGNTAIALLANTVATAAALVTLISTLGPVSGAHFNPVVSLASAWTGSLSWRDATNYVLVQTVSALAGVLLAHAMFDLPLLQASTHIRTGASQWLSEGVATFGLLTVIAGCVRFRPADIPVAVATYITSAYWFTASTSFANPAVTLARSVTNSFAGIRPADVPGFVLAQFGGAIVATLLARWLFTPAEPSAPR